MRPRLHLITIAVVYFSYTFHISSGTPILDQHIQPLAPFSLSPGNVNLETYWADKYRTQEGGDKPPLPVGQPNTDSNSPADVPPIVNNNDGNSKEVAGEVLSRQRRNPQHHPYYPHVPHGHGHHGHGNHGHGYHGHHNPHHGHHGHHHYSSLPIATFLHKPVFI